MKRLLSAAALLALLFFLLFFPKTALAAAQNGLLLWYRNLVPVLFPFMILSSLILRTGSILILLRFIHPLFHLIWGTSIYGSYAILAGCLFGCPMGAKTLRDLLEQESISRAEAEYLICFVNNLSPAFFITCLIHENLQRPDLLFPTLTILYGAPLITSMLFAPGFSFSASAAQKNKASKVPLSTDLLDACIFDGIINITRLGAYLVLFSLLGSAFALLPLKNTLLRCVIAGLLEITAGISCLCQTPLPFFTRYLSLMALCSFGGLCTLMQTFSVFPMERSARKHFLFAKTVTVLISILLTLFLFL